MVLYSPSGSVVRSVRARPEPNLETEQRVREQLQSLDSLLDIKWYPHAVFNERYGDFEGRYALICKWPTSDKRWQLYQNGEIDDPVDMLGWFCTDLHEANSIPVSPDAIENKVIELLGKCDGERLSHTKRMKQLVGKNAELRRSRRAAIVDQAGDIARDLHWISGHVEEVTLDRIKNDIINEAKKNV